MKKYLLSLSIVGMAAAAMAFTGEKASEKPVLMQYQFNGESLDEVYDLNQWSQVSGGGPSCGGSAIPCVVTVQNQESLEDWLNARTPQQIRNEASSRKD
ncbi:hypothetical protein [Pontibacter actiniarum]|uniref:Uncharacterized protein n=1 Tax=Pontibacter actiniarum TaxID=323450 RepID=A0A1X9YSG8_9BACT|nr:hypothetical protein [Pontibacter actiniarum]ARS35803.1 hypothetical protein CA264_10305 [Pontibacter actiniarum]